VTADKRENNEGKAPFCGALPFLRGEFPHNADFWGNQQLQLRKLT